MDAKLKPRGDWNWPRDLWVSIHSFIHLERYLRSNATNGYCPSVCRICIISRLTFQAAGTIGPSWIHSTLALSCLVLKLPRCLAKSLHWLIYCRLSAVHRLTSMYFYNGIVLIISNSTIYSVSGFCPEPSAKTVAVPHRTVSRLTLTCLAERQVWVYETHTELSCNNQLLRLLLLFQG